MGEKEKTDAEAERTGAELTRLLRDLEAAEIKDIQPVEMDEEEVLPDASVYDAIRFLVKELEAEGQIDCPCHAGSYDLRFCKEGIQVFCPDCGASHIFNTEAVAASEEYLNIDKITLN